MKKAKITPIPAGHNKKVVIDEDEFSDSERVEYVCNFCHTGPLVTINDKAGNSDLFCRRCSAVFDPQDNTIRHKQRLSVPLEIEPAATSTPGIGVDAVAIRHPKELRGGIAELQKRGLKITYFATNHSRV